MATSRIQNSSLSERRMSFKDGVGLALGLVNSGQGDIAPLQEYFARELKIFGEQPDSLPTRQHMIDRAVETIQRGNTTPRIVLAMSTIYLCEGILPEKLAQFGYGVEHAAVLRIKSDRTLNGFLEALHIKDFVAVGLCASVRSKYASAICNEVAQTRASEIAGQISYEQLDTQIKNTQAWSGRYASNWFDRDFYPAMLSTVVSEMPSAEVVSKFRERSFPVDYLYQVSFSSAVLEKCAESLPLSELAGVYGTLNAICKNQDKLRDGWQTHLNTLSEGTLSVRDTHTLCQELALQAELDGDAAFEQARERIGSLYRSQFANAPLTEILELIRGTSNPLESAHGRIFTRLQSDLEQLIPVREMIFARAAHPLENRELCDLSPRDMLDFIMYASSSMDRGNHDWDAFQDRVKAAILHIGSNREDITTEDASHLLRGVSHARIYDGDLITPLVEYIIPGLPQLNSVELLRTIVALVDLIHTLPEPYIEELRTRFPTLPLEQKIVAAWTVAGMNDVALCHTLLADITDHLPSEYGWPMRLAAQAILASGYAKSGSAGAYGDRLSAYIDNFFVLDLEQPENDGLSSHFERDFAAVATRAGFRPLREQKIGGFFCDFVFSEFSPPVVIELNGDVFHYHKDLQGVGLSRNSMPLLRDIIKQRVIRELGYDLEAIRHSEWDNVGAKISFLMTIMAKYQQRRAPIDADPDLSTMEDAA